MSDRVKQRRAAFRAWVTAQGGIPAVSAKSGVPKTTLYSYLNHEKTDDLSAGVVGKITSAYDVPTDDLFGASRKTVPLVGYVGAGAEAHFYDIGQDAFDEVEAPAWANADTVAVKINGQSMGAWYDSWTVFYDEVRSPVTEDLIGEVCVVGLEDGRVLVKQLQASRNAGYFHLISLTEPPITDAVVAWAAKVREMRPGR